MTTHRYVEKPNLITFPRSTDSSKTATIFETIDALDRGGSWPTLKTLLGATSAEILLGILSPNESEEAALKSNGLGEEAKEFVQAWPRDTS
jgi:hypothetical protein